MSGDERTISTGGPVDAPAVGANGGPTLSTTPHPVTAPPGPGVLESRFRRLLRLLPRGYRSLREEEMVGTFLTTMHDADPENYDLTVKHGRPSSAEARAVLALAVRLRWGENVAPERFAVRAVAARTFLLIGVTIAWVYAVAQLIGIGLAFILDPAPDGGLSAADMYRATFALAPGTWNWWSTWAYVGWVAVLPLLVSGGRAGGRWSAMCAAAGAAVPVGVQAITVVRGWISFGHSAAGALGLVISLALLGLLVALAVQPLTGSVRPATDETGSPMPQPSRFLTAGCIAALLLTAYAGIVWATPSLWNQHGLGSTLFQSAGWLLSFDAGWWTLAAVGYGIGLVACRRNPADPVGAAGRVTGCAVVAGVATVLSSAMPAASMGEYSTPYTATAAAQIALAGGIFVISVVVAAHRRRALPLGRYSGADDVIPRI